MRLCPCLDKEKAGTEDGRDGGEELPLPLGRKNDLLMRWEARHLPIEALYPSVDSWEPYQEEDGGEER